MEKLKVEALGSSSRLNLNEKDGISSFKVKVEA